MTSCEHWKPSKILLPSMVHWGVEEISLDNLDWNESKIGVQSRHSPPIINGSSMASSGQIHLETELHSMRSCCCESCRWFVAWRFIQESRNLFHSMRSRIELHTTFINYCAITLTTCHSKTYLSIMSFVPLHIGIILHAMAEIGWF